MSIPAACSFTTARPSTRRTSAAACAAAFTCAFARRLRYAWAMPAILPTVADVAASVFCLSIDRSSQAEIEADESLGLPERCAGEADRDQFFKREQRPDWQTADAAALSPMMRPQDSPAHIPRRVGSR